MGVMSWSRLVFCMGRGRESCPGTGGVWAECGAAVTGDRVLSALGLVCGLRSASCCKVKLEFFLAQENLKFWDHKIICSPRCFRLRFCERCEAEAGGIEGHISKGTGR